MVLEDSPAPKVGRRAEGAHAEFFSTEGDLEESRPCSSIRETRRSMKKYPIIALCLFLGIGLTMAEKCEGQAVEIFPPELNRVPISALGSGRYWQQLRIVLDHADAASDSVVSVVMPLGISVVDTDGDGRMAEEVRVVYEPVGSEIPGIVVSPATTALRIVLHSARPAAAGGTIYLQFPIITQFSIITAEPPPVDVNYGRVEFAAPSERDLEVGPTVKLIAHGEFDALASMDLVRFNPVLAQGVDTTTTALGAVFPDEGQVLLQPPPDLVFDAGVGTLSNLLNANTPGIEDGFDDNDTQYRLFWSSSPNLTTVDGDAEIEAMVVVGEEEEVYFEGEKGERAVRLLTRDIPAGIYYLYITSPLTGDIPLARSRAIDIRHEPVILRLGPSDADITLDSGRLLNLRGEATGEGQESAEIEFAVIDHDDEVGVGLFYSERGDLETTVIVLDEQGVSSIGGAFPIPGGQGLEETRTSFAWNIVEPELVAAGDYYVYAAASDGETHSLRRSERQVRVRHSPFLRLDALNDEVISGADTIVTGGVEPQRFVTFTWGRRGFGGDEDVDDDARISLYYSPIPAITPLQSEGWSLPGGVDEFLATLGDQVRSIATDIAEDPDRRQDNQYVWDLWQLEENEVPEEGTVFYVYGIIEDAFSRRLVQLNGGRLNDAASRLVFNHPPALRLVQPVANVVLQPDRSGRIAWEDVDLDGDARLRVLLSQVDLGPIADYAEVVAGGAIVVNAEEGKADPAVDPERDLSENDPTDHLDIRVDELKIGNGTYFPYVAITDERFDTGALAWRGGGEIEVQGVGEAGAGDESIRVLPQVFTVGTEGGRQVSEVRIDAGGERVDLVLVTLRVDASFFDVADQDSLREGVQPFVIGENFSLARLVTNRAVQTGDGGLQLVLEYFEPTAANIPGLDGESALATFTLIALKQEGLAIVELESDGNGGGLSRLERDGQLVAAPPPGPVAEGTLVVGRGLVRGKVELEGRSDMTAAIEVSLRQRGRYVDVQDSLFIETNDAVPESEGVQIQLAEDGSFELTQVPVGRLDLHLHLDGYLDGWIAGLDLYPAQIVEDQVMKLLGGDVAGYLDVDGSTLPDNEVTLADWDYVASFYGAVAGEGEEVGLADITADGAIDIKDLSLVGANYRDRGPQPVYKEGIAEAGEVLLSLHGRVGEVVQGQVVELAVRGQGMRGVRAFELELRYAEGDWAMVGQETAGGLSAQRRDARGWVTAAVLLGRERDFGAIEELVVWRMRALRTGAAAPVLRPRTFLDRWEGEVAARLLNERILEVLPSTFALGQNYPNPFNPKTTIPFAVPAIADVRLEVFDVIGQRVAVLWDGELGAGEHRLDWDGRDEKGRMLGSGVYLYRLQLPQGEIEIKRMLLVR
jgi:hypothetical protein